MHGPIKSQKWVVYGRRINFAPVRNETRSVTKEFFSEEEAVCHWVTMCLTIPTGWILHAVLVRVDKHEFKHESGPRFTDVNHVLMRAGEGRCWDGQ
jgi:hypothetical protein